MKKEKFSININPTEKDWKYLLQNSPQSSIFCEKIYLDKLNINFKRILILRSNQIKAGILLLLSEDCKNIIEDEFVIYGGILFVEDPEVKNIKKSFENFEVQEYITNYIASNYSNIFISLSPEIKDIRPFLWYQYHSNNLNEKFFIDIRYTSYLNISELQEYDDIFNTKLFRSMHTLRKRHLKKAFKTNHKVINSTNPSNLISFYESLMLRQGEEVDPLRISIMKNLITGLINEDRGILLEIQNEFSQTIYTVFYVWDRLRAYYLFGAGNPDKSEPWQGTLAHWESFKYLSKNMLLKEVDFEGVNSPKRGWFKLSFSGELVNYYHVKRKLF